MGATNTRGKSTTRSVRPRWSNRHRFGHPSVLAAAVFLAAAALSVPSCHALTGNFFPRAAEASGGNTQQGVRIRFCNALTDPSEREALQKCRRTAFDPEKQNWMNSERDFVNAQSVLDEKHLCVVALDEATNEIVGSADLYPKKGGKPKNTVLNVFVRPDQRGRGIGRRLMVEGIEEVLVPLLGGACDAVLSLDVYTQNTPAIELYKKLGYEPASPMHAGTLGLATVTQANLVVTLSKTVKAGGSS